MSILTIYILSICVVCFFSNINTHFYQNKQPIKCFLSPYSIEFFYATNVCIIIKRRWTRKRHNIQKSLYSAYSTKQFYYPNALHSFYVVFMQIDKHKNCFWSVELLHCFMSLLRALCFYAVSFTVKIIKIKIMLWEQK